jgi:5-methylcytosine-specific restriction endonuclease McrA
MTEETKQYETYHDYLNSSVWKKLRQVALDRAGNRCQVCNSKAFLEVHHRRYTDWGSENITDLTVLCKKCHLLFSLKVQKPDVVQLPAGLRYRKNKDWKKPKKNRFVRYRPPK